LYLISELCLPLTRWHGKWRGKASLLFTSFSSLSEKERRLDHQLKPGTLTCLPAVLRGGKEVAPIALRFLLPPEKGRKKGRFSSILYLLLPVFLQPGKGGERTPSLLSCIFLLLTCQGRREGGKGGLPPYHAQLFFYLFYYREKGGRGGRYLVWAFDRFPLFWPQEKRKTRSSLHPHSALFFSRSPKKKKLLPCPYFPPFRTKKGVSPFVASFLFLPRVLCREIEKGGGGEPHELFLFFPAASLSLSLIRPSLSNEGGGSFPLFFVSPSLVIAQERSPSLRERSTQTISPSGRHGRESRTASSPLFPQFDLPLRRTSFSVIVLFHILHCPFPFLVPKGGGGGQRGRKTLLFLSKLLFLPSFPGG